MKTLLKTFFVAIVLSGAVYAGDIDVYRGGFVTVSKVDAPLCEEYDDLIAAGKTVVTTTYRMNVYDTFVAYFYFDQNNAFISSYYTFGYPELYFGALAQIREDDTAPSFLRKIARDEIKSSTVAVDISTEHFNKIAFGQVEKLKEERERSK